jgi:hypothetical protein
MRPLVHAGLTGRKPLAFPPFWFVVRPVRGATIQRPDKSIHDLSGLSVSDLPPSFKRALCWPYVTNTFPRPGSQQNSRHRFCAHTSLRRTLICTNNHLTSFLQLHEARALGSDSGLKRSYNAGTKQNSVLLLCVLPDFSASVKFCLRKINWLDPHFDTVKSLQIGNKRASVLQTSSYSGQFIDALHTVRQETERASGIIMPRFAEAPSSAYLCPNAVGPFPPHFRPRRLLPRCSTNAQ